MLIKAIKSKIITGNPQVGRARREYEKSTNNYRKSINELLTHLFGALQKRVLKEGDILVITSKVVAIAQGRIRKIANDNTFGQLVIKEADALFGEGPVTLALKNSIFTPWAGIDRSNIPKNSVVLWPEQPFQMAYALHKALIKKYKIKKIGVLITDSFCAPMRRGVCGIAIGYAGFRGVNDLRGKKDIYGNTLNVSQQAVADMLASAALLVMGESAEKTPFAIISDAPVFFTSSRISPSETVMNPEECVFFPFYQAYNKCNSNPNIKKIGKTNHAWQGKGWVEL